MESYSVQATLSAVDKGFSSAFKNAANTAQSMSQKISGALSGIGKGTMAAGALITAFGAKSLQTYGDFASNINKAAVVAGSSNKKLAGNMKGLTQVAVNMGKELPISIQDASQAMVEMARQGASVGDIKKEFPPIARAAASAGEDLTSVATTVQQSMNIWGGGMKTATKNSATMAIVANKSSASIGDMQQVFANVGTTAKNLGYSLKDVSIATGVLTNAGVPAAQASMDLNHAFTQMVKPSKTAQAEMKKLGLSYTDAQGNMKPMKQVLQETAKATSGMSGATKTAALNMLFGAAGAKAITPLLDSVTKGAHKNGQGWDDLSAAVDKGAGSYAKANKYLKDNAQNMTHNVGDAIDQMKDAWQGLTISAMSESAPMIQKIAKAFADLADTIGNMHGPLGDIVKGFIAFAPVIGPVVIAIGAFITGIGKIVGVLGGAGKALGTFIGKTRGVGTASVATAGQIAAMGLKFLGIGVGIGAAAAGLGIFAMGIAKMASAGTAGLVTLAAMTAAITVLAGVFALLNGPLTAAVPAMLALSAVMLSAGAGAAMLGTAIGLAGVGINLAGQGVLRLVQAFVLLGQNMTMIIPTMTAVGQGFAMMITSFVTTMATQIPQVTLAMSTMILGMLTTIATYMPQFMVKGVQIIVGFLQGLATGMPRIIAAATNMIVNFLNALTASLPRIIVAGAQTITSFLNGLAQNMGQVITAGVRVIAAFINGVANNLGRIINAGVNLLGKFLLGIANAIPKLASVGIKAVLRFVQGVGNAIGQALASGGKVLTAFVKGIIQGFGQASNAGKGAGQKGASGAKSTSGLFQSSGLGLVGRLATAIMGGGGKVSAAGKSAGSRGASGARGAQGAFRSAGSFIVSGLANGILGGAGRVVAAAASIAAKAAGVIKKALKIHSPSRVTYGFGAYFGEGFVNGIDSMQKNVAHVAGDMSSMASNALNDNIQALNSRVANGSISSNVTGQLAVQQQPANISLDLGGSNYTAFVNDISHKQGQTASLKRTYRV